MGNLQVTLLDELHGAYTASASSEHPSYPAINLKTPDRPFIEARTTSTSSQWFRADVGVSVTIAGVHLVNTNCTTYTIETSPDASAWTTQASGTLNKNPYTSRFQAYISFSAPVTARYVRANLSNAGGASYISCGGLAVLAVVNTFAQNFSAITIDPHQRLTVLEDIGQSNVEGELGVTYRFGKEHWYRATGNALTLLRRLRRIGAGYVIFHENNGDTSEAYVCRLVSATPFQLNFRTVGTELVFEERV